MNRLVDEEIERNERGFSLPSEGAVCGNCAGDAALVSLIRDAADSDSCSFCGKRGRSIALDVEPVLTRIGSQLQIAWTQPENVLFRDSEQLDGFAGPVSEIDAVLHFEGVRFGSDEFERFVHDAFAETRFTPIGVFATTEGDALRFGWEDLVETVRHRKRFFFSLESNDRSDDGEGVPIPRGLELLNRMARMIEEYDLLLEIEPGTSLFRARIHPSSETPASAAELGAPPPDKAQQNRMSPAGIPMFYASESRDAAVEEARAANLMAGQSMTVALFQPTETVIVVDFSKLPVIPSVFDEAEATPRIRQELGFLYGFRRDIGQAVKHDGREHIEYVPTQVVCEYLRFHLAPKLGSEVHGVAWGSTRSAGSLNVALFLDGSRCVDIVDQRSVVLSGPLMGLLSYSCVEGKPNLNAG